MRVCQLAKTLLVHLECDVFGALLPEEFLEPLSSYVVATTCFANARGCAPFTMQVALNADLFFV